jgi:hypothetical protein
LSDEGRRREAAGRVFEWMLKQWMCGARLCALQLCGKSHAAHCSPARAGPRARVVQSVISMCIHASILSSCDGQNHHCSLPHSPRTTHLYHTPEPSPTLSHSSPPFSLAQQCDVHAYICVSHVSQLFHNLYAFYIVCPQVSSTVLWPAPVR